MLHFILLHSLDTLRGIWYRYLSTIFLPKNVENVFFTGVDAKKMAAVCCMKNLFFLFARCDMQGMNEWNMRHVNFSSYLLLILYQEQIVSFGFLPYFPLRSRAWWNWKLICMCRWIFFLFRNIELLFYRAVEVDEFVPWRGIAASILKFVRKMICVVVEPRTVDLVFGGVKDLRGRWTNAKDDWWIIIHA